MYLLACCMRVTVGNLGLCLCDVFRGLINSLVLLVLSRYFGPCSVSDCIKPTG